MIFRKKPKTLLLLFRLFLPPRHRQRLHCRLPRRPHRRLTPAAYLLPLIPLSLCRHQRPLNLQRHLAQPRLTRDALVPTNFLFGASKTSTAVVTIITHSSSNGPDLPTVVVVVVVAVAKIELWLPFILWVSFGLQNDSQLDAVF